MDWILERADGQAPSDHFPAHTTPKAKLKQLCRLALPYLGLAFQEFLILKVPQEFH